MTSISVRPHTLQTVDYPTYGPTHAAPPQETSPPVTSTNKPWDRLQLNATTPIRPIYIDDASALSLPLPEGAPPAGKVAAQIVLQAIEILSGHRPSHQLRHWLAPDVFHALCRRAGLALRIEGPAPRAKAPRIRNVLSTFPRPRVGEVIVIIFDGKRTRAAGVRLEFQRERWTVTALEIA